MFPATKEAVLPARLDDVDDVLEYTKVVIGAARRAIKQAEEITNAADDVTRAD